MNHTPVRFEDRIKYPLALPFRPAKLKGTLPANEAFPFGQPAEIDYKELDQAGVELIREINLRPWMATVNYCSGHPSDRPLEEETPWSKKELYKGMKRWSVHKEVEKLNRQLRGHRLGKDAYVGEISDLLDASRTYFNLNLNIYNLKPFIIWMRAVFTIYSRTFMKFESYQMPELTLNPFAPEVHFGLTIGYYSEEHRIVLHLMLLEALRHIPI